MILKELLVCVFFWKSTTYHSYIYIHYPHSRRYVFLIVKEWVCVSLTPKNLLVTLNSWGQNWVTGYSFPGFTSSKIILNPSHPHEPIYVNMSCFLLQPPSRAFLSRQTVACLLVGQNVQSIWNPKIARSKAGRFQEEKKGPVNHSESSNEWIFL